MAQLIQLERANLSPLLMDLVKLSMAPSLALASCARVPLALAAVRDTRGSQSVGLGRFAVSLAGLAIKWFAIQPRPSSSLDLGELRAARWGTSCVASAPLGPTGRLAVCAASSRPANSNWFQSQTCWRGPPLAGAGKTCIESIQTAPWAHYSAHRGLHSGGRRGWSSLRGFALELIGWDIN